MTNQQPQHTPGPYKAVYRHAGAGVARDYHNIVDAQGRKLAEVYDNSDVNRNAYLFEAAPDMLAALETLFSWDGFDSALPSSMQQEIEAAIAKAKGQQAGEGV